MSVQDEMDRTIAELEDAARAALNKAEALRSLRAKQVLQLASPRVVAGPLRIREDRVLTHATCPTPCATCDDDGRPDAS